MTSGQGYGENTRLYGIGIHKTKNVIKEQTLQAQPATRAQTME